MSKFEVIGSQQISAFAIRLRDAEDKVQSAKNSGDAQALGYAEGEVIRMRRELAKLDPHGYGHMHLDLLTQAERQAALQ
jgi:hypothetical protein